MTSKTPPLAPSPSTKMISSASPLNQMSDSQHPNEDLTLFVHDMLNQMVRAFCWVRDQLSTAICCIEFSDANYFFPVHSILGHGRLHYGTNGSNGITHERPRKQHQSTNGPSRSHANVGYFAVIVS